MKVVRKLFELQAVQKEIERLTHKIERIDADVDSYRKKWVDVKKLLQLKEDALKELKERLLNEELDLKEIEEHIATLKERLYSGKGKSKELSGMQRKVENLSKKRDEKETVVLELMDEISSAEEEFAKVSEDARLQMDSFMQMIEEAMLKRKEMEQQVGKLHREEDDIKKEIEKKYLSLYYELKESLKNPVAVVKDGICMGCSISLPSDTIKRLKEDTEIVRCDSCGRMLMIEGD